MSLPPTEDHFIGQVLGDAYHINHLIAEGGMGKVYEASHIRLAKKKFAIKVLLPNVLDNEEAFARFRREAEVTSEIGHPHIVNVLDFNHTKDGLPYLVMEYLEGTDLHRYIVKNGVLSLSDTVHIIRQIGSALQAAHERGIVHRDMKPENVFLVQAPGEDLQVKLLDFGLSKIKHSNIGLTRDRMVFGTPEYMSPEQAEGDISEIDQRTDIFALGVIAYRCLCGKSPFQAPTPPGILYQVVHVQPPPIHQVNPKLPESLHLVLSRAMAKKKTERYPQVEYFVADLCQALEEHEAQLARELAASGTQAEPEIIEQRPGRKRLTSPYKHLRQGGVEHLGAIGRAATMAMGGQASLPAQVTAPAHEDMGAEEATPVVGVHHLRKTPVPSPQPSAPSFDKTDGTPLPFCKTVCADGTSPAAEQAPRKKTPSVELCPDLALQAQALAAAERAAVQTEKVRLLKKMKPKQRMFVWGMVAILLGGFLAFIGLSLKGTKKSTTNSVAPAVTLPAATQPQNSAAASKPVAESAETIKNLDTSSISKKSTTAKFKAKPKGKKVSKGRVKKAGKGIRYDEL